MLAQSLCRMCDRFAGYVRCRSADTDGGRPHAEANALGTAGSRARDATLYTSLEPCSHEGKTPPCAEAIRKAGVRRVVAQCSDPDRRVDGRGFALLRKAGIDVVVLGEFDEEILGGHVKLDRVRRPWITLKIAASLDGAVATADRKRTRITGEPARRFVSTLRSEHDAILVGAGTIRSDDPLLLPRDPALCKRPPVRIVLATELFGISGTRLLESADQGPVWICHAHDATTDPDIFERSGIQAIPVAANAAGLDLDAVLEALGAQGLHRVLVEAGPRLAAALLAGGHVDEIVWLTAGRVFGTAGLPALGGAATARFQLADRQLVGEDVATRWRPRTHD